MFAPENNDLWNAIRLLARGWEPGDFSPVGLYAVGLGLGVDPTVDDLRAMLELLDEVPDQLRSRADILAATLDEESWATAAKALAQNGRYTAEELAQTRDRWPEYYDDLRRRDGKDAQDDDGDDQQPDDAAPADPPADAS